MNYHVELRGITKRFPGVLANDSIDLAVERGEIRAIVGENGAGKSTLMSILYGLYQPDEGEIYLNGRLVKFSSPISAIAAGIGMVHQHFMLFPSLSVTDNVIYGAEPTRGTLVDQKTGRQRVQELAEQYGLQVDPDRKVRQLPVGVQQRVEILKALYRQADLLILDEPTAVLTPQEREGLFRILRKLSAEQKTIIFITHKLQEVMELSDNATILRNGKVTANLRAVETSPVEICNYMVGREVLLRVDKTPATPGDTVLEVNDLSLRDQRDVSVLQNVSLTVCSGEIVGIAGVSGNGQEDLIQILTGLRPVDSGCVTLAQNDITSATVGERRATGMAYIPEDRAEVGLALEVSVAENLLLGYQRSPQFAGPWGLLRLGTLTRWARDLVKNFEVKTATVAEPAAKMSGGNMQKLILAREFSHQSPLIIAEQPTRGVDVAAIENIHRRLIEYRDEGHAILLVSADLNEILSLSDRVYVMFAGQIVGELPATEATEHKLGLLMAGIRD